MLDYDQSYKYNNLVILLYENLRKLDEFKLLKSLNNETFNDPFLEVEGVKITLGKIGALMNYHSITSIPSFSKPNNIILEMGAGQGEVAEVILSNNEKFKYVICDIPLSIFISYSRLKKDHSAFPDLILIDGGKGQLNSAKRTLDRLGLGFIEIVALAKKLEEVFVPGVKSSLSLSKTSSSLMLLREIRDEVHRFSINYHRSLRNKKNIDSNILKIDGMGQKRFQILMKEYKTLPNILRLTSLEISKKTKIPLRVCIEMLEKMKKS